MFLYFVFIVYTLSHGICEEPKSCSQFYYVDKLLDKMIRMEVKVEGIDKEIAGTNADVLSVLEELKREREAFKNDIMELKKQIKDDIEEIKENAITPNVVFKAKSPQDKSPEAPQTIIFNEIMFNNGDGYDNTTGIFTVPVNGTYLFTFQFCINSQNNMYYGLVYDNVVHTSGRFYDDDARICYTGDGMLHLKTGQKVWIKCLSASGSLYEYTTSSYNYWNTFSGMLIHK